MSIINFNNTTPAAPGGNTNVTWQTSGDQTSGYVPTAGINLETNGTPNASQVVLNLIAGTNVTITDGGGGAITIAATGGGGASGLVLLETETAGGSTSNIPCTTRNASGQSGNTFQADFDEYLIEVSGLINGSSGTVGFQTSANSGGAWDTGSNYAWQACFADTTGAGGQSSAGDTIMNWFASATTPATDLSWVGTFRLYNPAATSLFPQMVGLVANPYSGASVMHMISWGGFHKSLTAINAIRIIASAGNITAGTIRIYGLSK
jgi:hypothetical protein